MDLKNLLQKRQRGILAACLPTLVIACAPTQPGLDEPRPREAPLVLKVRNENAMDVRLFAVRGTLESRLGMVPTMRTEYFKVPSYLYRGTGAVRFKVDPIGGAPGYVTDPVLVNGIHRIDLRLEKPFAYSRILVR